MKKKIFFLSLLLVFQLGCGKKDVETGEARIISTDTKAETMDILHKSEDISDIVVELFGIDDATTIVFNNIALVTVIPSYDKELDIELREVISKKVIESFPSIGEVKIGDNKKIFSQTDKIIVDLLQGAAFDDYVKEISDIMDKIDRK